MPEIKNMRVTQAGYKYYGHFRKGELILVLESSGFGCRISPKDEFGLVDLFKVFDYDSEDGVMLESLQGGYCRVHFNEQGYPQKLQHLTKDSVFWNV